MDLTQLLALFPALFSGPYSLPILLGLFLFGPAIVKKFPGLASILASLSSLFNKSPMPSPLTPVPNPAPTPGPQFPLLDSLLSLFKRDGKPIVPAELSPDVLARLRDEVNSVIRYKVEKHTAELANLQGMEPEPSKPFQPFLTAAGK